MATRFVFFEHQTMKKRFENVLLGNFTSQTTFSFLYLPHKFRISLNFSALKLQMWTEQICRFPWGTPIMMSEALWFQAWKNRNFRTSLSSRFFKSSISMWSSGRSGLCFLWISMIQFPRLSLQTHTYKSSSKFFLPTLVALKPTPSLLRNATISSRETFSLIYPIWMSKNVSGTTWDFEKLYDVRSWAVFCYITPRSRLESSSTTVWILNSIENFTPYFSIWISIFNRKVSYRIF